MSTILTTRRVLAMAALLVVAIVTVSISLPLVSATPPPSQKAADDFYNPYALRRYPYWVYSVPYSPYPGYYAPRFDRFRGGAVVVAAVEKEDAETQIQRGRYLVHNVGMCVQCHSPRDETGNLIESQLLQGGPVLVRSPFPDDEWAYRAPAIAGLPGWDASDAIVFLQTGRGPHGRPAQPPMPPFRFTREHATAIVAYLKSIR